MTSFFFSKRDTSPKDSETVTYQYIQPEADDHACFREIEFQRFKWNAFIKARPKLWSEQWLWQNWKTTGTKSSRPLVKMMSMFSSKQKAHKKLKKLIRGGVPPELRGSVWWACSGAAEKMTAAPAHEQYQVLVGRAAELTDTHIANDIEKDLLRTFPDRLKAENVEMIDTLRRVLMAYALRNTMVGYCQSMNYICALMLFHMSEEQAFWLLATLLEDILPVDYYAPSLMGGRIDQQVFQSCIAWKLPQLHAQFKNTGTMLEPIICPWFLCLYINVLPLYSTCRVWDCMFWEGSVVLFRIGLTLIKSKTKYLMEANDFIGVYGILKSSSAYGREHSYTLESAAPTSPTGATSTSSLTSESQSTSTSSSNAAAVVGVSDVTQISDTQNLINNAFGFRWMRSVPKAKVDHLRAKFQRLLNDEHDDRNSSSTPSTPSSASSKEFHRTGSKQTMTASNSSPNRLSSGKREPKKNRTRKSTYILKVLGEHDITVLHDLALELDEGLGSHVEEFARELHSDSADGSGGNGGVTAYSKDEAEDDEDDEEVDGGDEDDLEELPESL